MRPQLFSMVPTRSVGADSLHHLSNCWAATWVDTGASPLRSPCERLKLLPARFTPCTGVYRDLWIRFCRRSTRFNRCVFLFSLLQPQHFIDVASEKPAEWAVLAFLLLCAWSFLAAHTQCWEDSLGFLMQHRFCVLVVWRQFPMRKVKRDFPSCILGSILPFIEFNPAGCEVTDALAL